MLSFDHTRTATYDEIASKIKPLDLIAFRGGDVISDLITIGEKLRLDCGEFSHVGIAVTSEILPSELKLKPGRVYVWESTLSLPSALTGDAPNIATGTSWLGVQIRDLYDVTKSYLNPKGDGKSRIGWCPLLNNPWNIGDRDQVIQKFIALYASYNDRFYEMNPLTMVASLFSVVRPCRDFLESTVGAGKSWKFCSELAATVYQAYGLIGPEKNPKDVVPVDFFGCDSDGLPALVETPTYFLPVTSGTGDEPVVASTTTVSIVPTTRRALLIGINYRGSDCALSGCINDALNAKSLLSAHYSFSEDNILLLTDDTPLKPTRKNILAAWEWLVSGAPASSFQPGAKYAEPLLKGASLYFHYSGHGSSVKDKDGDEVDGKDEALVPIDCDDAGLIIDDEVRKALVDKVPHGCRLTAVMDCCYSGSNFDLLWNYSASSGSSFVLKKEGQYAPTAAEVIMLSGCKDNQYSSDLSRGSQSCGALTYSLIKVLEEANYSITWDQLLQKLRSFIRKNKLSNQVPCLSFGRWEPIEQPFLP